MRISVTVFVVVRKNTKIDAKSLPFSYICNISFNTLNLFVFSKKIASIYRGKSVNPIEKTTEY